MIKIFSPTDKIYNSNGDIVIKPLRAVVFKEDNGEYYLNLETDISYVNYLVDGNIVVANTPQGDQAFRVGNVEKTKSKITVKAMHVFYDSLNYLIADSYVVDKTCNDALDHLNNATDNESPFTTLSDITTVNSYRCVRNSLYEAIQTVLERWGGHLVRNNWSIEIRTEIGQDNGVTVQYKKNLREITCTSNWENVVTKLLPVGANGILLNDLDKTEDIYVYADNQYTIPYTKTVSFNQDLQESDYADETAYKQALINDLRMQAIAYVNANSTPQVNYTLSANIDRITDVGDTIQVIDDRLGINLLTRVISFEYDCIQEKYTEVQFGNFTPTLSNLMSNITAEITTQVDEKTSDVKVELGDELNKATADIWDTLGASYVIYEGDKILVVDQLPKESATNVIMINNGGIGFSKTGINGTFTSAWTIDGTLNMQAINVINLTASMIKGGTLKLGASQNESGILELYNEANDLIAEMTKDGLKMYAQDGSYIVINSEVGFAGYNRNNVKIYWADGNEFHMRKSVIEEEITLCNKMRFIPITVKDNNNNIINDGIGLVSVAN